VGSNPTPGTTGPKPTAGNVSCFPSKHSMEEAMQAVRKVTLEADSRITESIKWSTPTYSYQGNIFSFNREEVHQPAISHRGTDPGRPSGPGG
jgi:hypothetical protein